MSPLIAQPNPVIPGDPVSAGAAPARKHRWWSSRMLGLAVAVAGLAAAAWGGLHIWRAIGRLKETPVPTVKVMRGDLALTIHSTGELHGQNPETLVAPMTGGTELHLTSLLKPGTLVKAGDAIATFDTTEQEYKLKEAEADLAEAQQKVVQAKAQQDAQEEEDRYALAKAQSDVKLAELDVRKNPLLSSIAARQNDLALSAARDKLSQLQQNIRNRAATGSAGAAIQEAGRAKAESQAKTARENIDALTLRAHRAGYVSVRQNSNQNMVFWGMTLPLFQVGDAVRPGMAVAEIPDLQNWEVEANIGELDRGHLAVGDPVAISVVALPNRTFPGHVKDIAGTTGPPWNRRFACKLGLDQTSPELRPGMSAQLIITTEQMRGVLSLPAQALFETGGRTFVYAKSPTGSFHTQDVKLVRRNETRVVITGVQEGQLVALANPAEVAKKPGAMGSPMESLPK